LVSAEKQQVLVDVIRRSDRGNTPKTFPEIIDTIQDLEPVSRKQARDAYDRTIKPTHKKVLTGIIKAQRTTTKRSAITAEQQWRWHAHVDSMRADLIRLNREATGEEELPPCRATCIG